MSRADLFQEICRLIGPAVVGATPRDGWPGIARIAVSTGPKRLALHISRVGSHSRAPYERRFQNPAGGEVVSAPPGAIPLLVGYAEYQGTPVLVVADGRSRLGRATRFSILFNVSVIQQAALTGWGEYTSTTGETIVALNPKLLPAYVEALVAGVMLDEDSVADTAAALGLLNDNDDQDDEESAERARSAVSRLVRRAAFSREVLSAYSHKCAMCSINLGLLEGAHIYPASAPGSADQAWNGLALCRNHHRLFDRYQIWVDPQDQSVRWRPDVLQLAQVERIVTNLVENTRPRIALPRIQRHHPRPEMFRQRYELAGALYDWAAA